MEGLFITCIRLNGNTKHIQLLVSSVPLEKTTSLPVNAKETLVFTTVDSLPGFEVAELTTGKLRVRSKDGAEGWTYRVILKEQLE